MDGVRDLGVTRGVGRVLGLWILEKVSEMERNQIGQFVNLTDILGIIGINHHLFLLLIV